MSDQIFNLDDPRLTAYALGEMDEEQRAALEQELDDSPAAQAEIEQIRLLADRLTTGLSQEPASTLTAAQRSAVETEAGAASASVAGGGASEGSASAGGGFKRVVIAVVSLAAVALLALALKPLWQSMREPSSRVAKYQESRAGSRAEHGATQAPATDSLYDDLTPHVGDRRRADFSQLREEAESGGARLPAPADGLVGGFRYAPGGDSGHRVDSAQTASSANESRLDGQEATMKEGEERTSGGSSSRATRRPGEGRYEGKPGDVTAAPGLESAIGGKGSRSGSAQPAAADPTSRYAIPPGQGPAATPHPTAEQPAPGQYGGRAPAGNPYGVPRTGSKPAPTLTSPASGTPGRYIGGVGGGAAPGLYAPSANTSAPSRPLTTQLETLPQVTQPPRADAGGGEAYENVVESEFLTPVKDPLSTFSIDVDTASYANVRRFLRHDQFPPQAAVRIEELVNYFHYNYPPPKGDAPFSVNLELGVCPWESDHRLARIGLKGLEIDRDKRPPSNLVFLVDVSGSMRDANKLPLVQKSLELLANQMTEDDRIAIVTYASSARQVLDSTGGNHKQQVLDAIKNLRAGGSTNGEGGIQMAYNTAVKNFYEGGANRIILCTDGDFNVGVSNNNELVKLIQDKAKSGVFLSIFGFGMGNLKDARLEQLADKGNGHYGYVDDLKEAHKVFVEELSGTLVTIAKDVKIQVEFNPAKVGAYRLIGYENRKLAARDFNDDTKDAGEIGAGHTVTALYELIPPGKLPKPADGQKLKYQKPAAAPANLTDSKELLTVKLRYKKPQEDQSRLLEVPLVDKGDASSQPSEDFDWAATVASFGMILRDSRHKGASDYDLLLELALGSKGADPSGRRREFIDLMYAARSIWARQHGLPTPTPPNLAPPEATAKASVNMKYRELLKSIAVPADVKNYGAFTDYGRWEGTSYAGFDNLPKGHWVYVFPKWYIWDKAK